MLIAYLNVNIKYKSITPSNISFRYGFTEIFRFCRKLFKDTWGDMAEKIRWKIEDKIR